MTHRRQLGSRRRCAGLLGPLLMVALLPMLATPSTAEGLRVQRDRQGVFTLSNDPPADARSTAASTRPAVLRSSRYDALIDYHARRVGLDSSLVRAVVQVESDFDPGARSHKGALGLMQLMPATAAELGVDDVFDPAENIRGGTDYLRNMMERFGRLELALAGYNAGPSAVDRHGGIPPYDETRRYVRKVLSLYRGAPVTAVAVSAPAGRPVEVVRRADDTVLLVTPD